MSHTPQWRTLSRGKRAISEQATGATLCPLVAWAMGGRGPEKKKVQAPEEDNVLPHHKVK